MGQPRRLPVGTFAAMSSAFAKRATTSGGMAMVLPQPGHVTTSPVRTVARGTLTVAPQPGHGFSIGSFIGPSSDDRKETGK